MVGVGSAMATKVVWGRLDELLRGYKSYVWH